MAKESIKWGSADTPAEAIKWGEADTPADASAAAPAAAPVPAAEVEPAAPAGDPMGGGGAEIMAVAEPRRSSVLEGRQIPELPFDPAEGERLSRRSANLPAPVQRTPQEMRPAPEIQPRSIPRAVGDTAIALGQGAVGMVKGVADNFNAGDNAVSRTLDKSIQGLEFFKSDDLRNQAVQRDALISTAQRNQGEIAAARAAFNSIALFPAASGDVAARGIGSLIPTLGLGVAGLGPASMWATNALSNAGDAASQTADALRKLSPQEWSRDERYLSLLQEGNTHDEAVATLAPIYALPAQALGALTGAISGRTGVERWVAGRATGKALRDRAGRTTAEVLGEEGETLIPQAMGNVTVGSVDGKTPWSEGLGRASVETAMGSLPGAGLAARTSGPQTASQPSAEQLARSKGFLSPGLDQVTMTQRITRLREAGDTAVADHLQRQLDRQSADGELAALQLPAAQTPAFQDTYRGLRAGGMKPAEAAARTAVVTDFRETAAAAGMSEKAIAAAIDAAQKKGLDDLPGFLHRYTQSLASRGAAQAVDIGPQLEAARDAGITAAAESLYGDVKPAMDAAQALEDQQDAAPPATEPAGPAFQTGNDIAVTPEADAVHAAATSPLNDLPEPSQAQKDAGNYKVGRVRIAGMDISVENPQGSTRRGVDADGNPWETPLKHHYGYFRGTTANDGDKLDVFVVPGTPEDYRGPVFVVDQIDPKTGKLDEHKVILGARDETEAEAIYRSNYSADWNGLGAITRLPLPAFKAWAANGNKKEALGDIKTPQQTTEAGQATAALSTDQTPAAADGTAGQQPGAVQPAGETAGRAAAEQPAAVAPERSARQVAEDAERARVEEQRARRRAAAKEAAKPMEGLSVGTMPTNAEPVTVKDGVVYVGKYPAQNFDTGADVTVPADATPQQIATALREAGALGKHARIFGLPQETPAVEAAAQRSVDDRKLTAVRNADGKFQAVDDSGKIIPESPEFDTGPEADHWRRTVHNASPAEGRSTDRIEDFGEKIGGARKDVWTSYRDSLDEVSDDEIASQPLSKIWPQPDYQAMLDGGADPWTVGFMRAARDEIPAKPRVSYKVKRWAETVKMLRGFTTQLLDGSIDSAKARAKLAEAGVKSRGLLDIAGRIDLYMAVGHKQSLAGVRITAGEYNLYKGVEYKPAKVFWIVEKEAAATAFSNWPRELAIGDTRAEAIANFKAKYDSLEIQPPASKEVSFDIFVERGKDGFFIGKKIGRNIATLEGPFPDVKAAREYRAKNQAALLAKLEKVKEIPRERRDTNEPRVGEDMRNGQDATPQMFADAFGFRGVEFGNWVEQGKRQKDLNDAYDALMDMAAILGVPPRALSLNGELGLAFGARGTGGKGAAVAHYERDFVAINLTKKEGAGSLGHEWWHALDNYFSRMRSKPGDMMTEGMDVSLAARGSNFIANTAVRREMVQAFGEVVRAIKNTALKARSAKLDAKRTKEYWTTGPEMSARAFESYLISKLQDQNASNDYLANIVDETTWKAAESMGFELDDSYPYPTAGEIPAIRAGFDHFFQTVQTRETDQGVAMFARAGMDAAAFRRAFGAPEPMGVDRAQKIVGELTSTWENGPKLKVVAKASDLPGGSHPSDARGLILNGTAYIVAANNPTRDAVARTLGHEAIGHYGLWRSLGIDGTRHFQRNLQLAVKSGNKPINAIRDKVRRLYVDDNGRFNLTPEQEANEIAAFAVEDGVDPVTGEFKTGFSWLKQFWAKIAAFLRDTLGLPVRFTNAELQGMLVAAMQGLQAGQRLDGSGDVLVAAARQDQPVALPDVIVANSLGTATSLPDYPAAKAGDIGAAVKVARAVVTDKLVAKVREAIGDSRPVIVPVVAEEAAGRNKIPLAAAEVLAAKLGLETEAGIVQANRPHRTGMDGLDRIFAVPDFTGAVEAGRDYLLLDDTLTQGATFAALASHIRQAGGRVIAAVALTGKQYSATITPSDKSLQQLREKHGDLETDFRAATGYGFDALTQSEARYLANYEPAQRLRDRIAAEGRRARESGDPQTAGGLSRGAPAPFEPVKTRVGTAYKAGDIALAAPKLNPRQPGNGDSRFDYKIRDRAAFAQAKAQGLSDEQALEASHVGFVTLDVSPSGQFKALRYIMVFESQRGRGIANKVVGSIMATLPADASLQVYDILPAAVDFWAKMGAKFPRSEEFMEAHLTPQQYRSAYAQQQGTGRGTPDQRAGGEPQGDARGAGRGSAPDEGVARRGRDEGETSAYARGPGAPVAPDDNAPAGNAWSMPAETHTDRVVYELQDSRVDLKRVQQAIEAAGRDITEQWDARLAETLYPGRVAYRSKQFLDAEVKPLLKSMAVHKVDMDEISDYLHARGAEERNAQIAKVNPDMPDGGAGTNSKGVLMTTQAARDHLAGISATRRQVLDALAKHVDAITAGTRQLLVAEGLEKQETIDAWQKAYKNYVPMFRDEAESGTPHPQGTGFAVKGSASKRATGSTKQVTNMLAHVLMQREAAVTRAEKNRVALALYGQAMSHPNPEFWTTIRPSMSDAKIEAELQAMGVDPATATLGMERAPTLRTVDEATGKVVDRPNPMYRNLPGAIPLKVNGDDRVLMLNTGTERGARLAENLKNLDGLTRLDLAGSIVGKSTRWLASVNTQYNPAFGLVNLTRDTLGGAINLGSTELRGKALKVLAQAPAAIAGIAWELMRNNQSSKWGKLYRQFVADGGQTGYKEMWRDPHERARAIEKELKAEGRLTPGKVAHAVLDVLDGFNTTLENAVRLSAYSAALDKGMSRPEAARLGRELTVDFNRKGRAGREIGPLYAFFNASVQGTARTIETLRGPTGAKVIAGGISLGILQALMLAAAGYDDDEIPEFVKARSLIIPMPGEGKQFISIPYPPGLHVLPNTGRVLAELVMNGGKNIGKRSVEAIGEIAAAFNPLGGGNVLTTHGALTTMAPTLVDPLIDLAANKNFAGNPIERQPFGGEADNRPGAARAKESTQRTTTGQVYIGISEAINRLTGGTQYEAGLASPTPERVRYLAQTVGGGVLRELEKGVNASTAASRGEKVKSSQIPVVGRFYGEVDADQVQTSRYFENSRTLRKAESSFKAMEKAGDAQALEKFVRDHPEVLMAESMREMQKAISELNQLAVTVIDNPKLMTEIDAARTELMKTANGVVKDMETKTDKERGRGPSLGDRLRAKTRETEPAN